MYYGKNWQGPYLQFNVVLLVVQAGSEGPDRAINRLGVLKASLRLPRDLTHTPLD